MAVDEVEGSSVGVVNVNVGVGGITGIGGGLGGGWVSWEEARADRCW